MDLYRRPLLAAADDLRRRVNNILGRRFLNYFVEGREREEWCGQRGGWRVGRGAALAAAAELHQGQLLWPRSVALR